MLNDAEVRKHLSTLQTLEQSLQSAQLHIACRRRGRKRLDDIDSQAIHRLPDEQWSGDQQERDDM